MKIKPITITVNGRSHKIFTSEVALDDLYEMGGHVHPWSMGNFTVTGIKDGHNICIDKNGAVSLVA